MSGSAGSGATSRARALLRIITDRARGQLKSMPSTLPEKPMIKSAMKRYEAFTGVVEVRDLHRNVVSAQEKFIASQQKRQEAGQILMNIQKRLKEIHAEMQSVSKGDPNYLRLITEEHKMIVDEEQLRKEFELIEREEREHFGTMTAAVKLSHETERMYTEKNKYLYVLASLFGTALGVIGSTINNKMKMAEFKELLLEEKSASRIWNIGVTDTAMQKKLGELETRVVAISTNQRTILDYIVKIEKMIENQFHNTKNLINTNMNNQKYDTPRSTRKFLSTIAAEPETSTQEILRNNWFLATVGVVGIYLFSRFVTG